MSTEAHRADYLAAARAVRGRLAFVRFSRGLKASHLWVGGAGLLAVLALRRVGEWREGEWLVAGGLVLGWLLLAGLVSRMRLPATERALRLLDGRGGWKDCFSSAWEFLNDPDPSEAERLHLSRAGALLPEAVVRIPRLIVPPSLGTVWIAPLLAVGFALLPWGRLAPDVRDLELTAEMREAAAEQAAALQRNAENVGDLTGLTEEEKKALEALRAEVDALAEDLANPGEATAGEMLDSLESRARAAEKLAGALDPFSDEWASEEMLAEMGRHPDTADLGLLIKDKAAEGAATESDRLSAALGDDAITSETEDRFTQSLERIAGAATEADRARPVGERFGNASRKLLDSQAKTASREFEELAKFFRELARREAAQKKLEELAENLREAGGEITGSELKKMEAAAEAPKEGGAGAPKGLQALDSGNPGAVPPGLPGQALSMPNPEGAPEAAPGIAQAPPQGEGKMEQVPVPGAPPGQGEAGNEPGKGEKSFSAPVPGEKGPEGQNGSGIGMSDQTKEGKGKGGMLSAPIPGMPPGEAAPGQGAAMNLGASSSGQSGQGGDQAGTGTAAMNDAPSETLKATGDAKVVAQAGKEGESTTRAIEGQAKAEQATRSRQEVMADFIAVEEQALDDQALPMSRRQQVLRYFSGIRAQFESNEASGNGKPQGN